MIGRRIAQARLEAGLTQEALAAKMRVTQRAVQWWEGDGRHPRPGQMKQLSRATGKPIAWFYTEAEAEVPA